MFDSATIPPEVNQTFLYLIPKSVDAHCRKNFQSIGLCNTVYKLITKVITNRLKPHLLDIIGEGQASFLPNKKANDHSIIVQEVISHFRKIKGKSGNMVLKIDLEKAFDRIEWTYIRDTLSFFNIPEKLSKLIMSCISTSSIQVLVNGRTTEAFYPSRGIRQGDPISPYIFIMCIERLSKTIHQAISDKLWTPIKISARGPSLSYLFFADDLTLFARADFKNCSVITDILQKFWIDSDQKVNCAKSRILFSKNCSTSTKASCTSLLGIVEKHSFGKYLGFPIFHNYPTNRDFQYLVDTVRQRLAGWKSHCLNMFGRTVLAKATLSGIPTHIMSYIKVLEGVSKILDKNTQDFIWGSTPEKKKIYLLNWDTVTLPKELGGLGIHKTTIKNKALFSGLVWRVDQDAPKL